MHYPSQFGSWALVVGASTTIGEQFARQLGERGMNVVLVARRKGVLDTIAREIHAEQGVETRVVALDLLTEGAVDQLAEAVADLEIALLVINANLHKVNLFDAMSLETKLKMVQMNVELPVRLCHVFGAPMVERGRGGILLVNALNALTALDFDGVFQGTKAFLTLFGESLWAEYRRHGVKVGVTMVNGIEGSESYEAKLSPQKRLLAKVIGGSMPPDRIVGQTLDQYAQDFPMLVPDFPIPINRTAQWLLTALRLTNSSLLTRGASRLFEFLLDGERAE